MGGAGRGGAVGHTFLQSLFSYTAAMNILTSAGRARCGFATTFSRVRRKSCQVRSRSLFLNKTKRRGGIPSNHQPLARLLRWTIINADPMGWMTFLLPDGFIEGLGGRIRYEESEKKKNEVG